MTTDGPDAVAVHVFTGADIREASARAIQLSPEDAPPAQLPLQPLRRLLLVPSSGHRGDPLLAAVSGALRDTGVGARQLAFMERFRPLGGWAGVVLAPPDRPRRRIRIAKALAGEHPWIVCNVDAVARTGPFVLDVFSRFLHPLDRARLLADRNRPGRAAEVNLAVQAGWCIVGGTAGAGHLLVVTHDVIAAELVALALSEHALGAAVDVTGPWEDGVVQRATELELGVRIPQQIGLVIHGDAEWARTEIDRMAGRIGLDYRYTP